MDSVKSYLLSLSSTAILCSVVISLSGKSGTVSSIVKFMSGLIITIVLIKPITDIKITQIDIFMDNLSDEASAAAASGQSLASAELDSIICSKLEAYILDKAASLGVTLHAEIVVEEHIPSKVYLNGKVSPYAKSQLMAYIKDSLGIPLEAQEWTGR